MNRVLTIARVVWLGLLRRKDIYVLLVLLGAMLVALVSLNIFGLGGTPRYVEDVGLSMALLFGWLLSIHAGARELPQEESRGTVFPLLARPVTRGHVLVGKWLGVWVAVCTAAVLFIALVAGVSLGMGGRFNPPALLQGFLLQAVLLGLLCAVALAFSTRMNHDAAATLSYVLSAAAFLVVPRIPEFLAVQKGVRATALLVLYHLLPHAEIFDMRRRLVHDYGPAPWGAVALVMLYGAVWTALVLLLAWLAYRRKAFERGKLGE